MKRLLTVTSLLAFASVPALAQNAEPLATPPADEAPMDSAAQPSAQPAPATDAAPQSAAAPSREESVRKLVDAEFPTYDADKNGELSQTEFSNWVMALHSKAEAAGAAKKDEAAKAKWAKDAFAAADADKSKKISKAEMSKFLQG